MNLDVDREHLLATLEELIAIPSPTGQTSAVADFVGERLASAGLDVRRTRRGAIHAILHGNSSAEARAVAVHLDTLGAIITEIDDDGCARLAPVGTWSSRYAEGARVTVLGPQRVRGTVLPPKASGHIHNEDVDSAPIGWKELRLRLDVASGAEPGVRIGDFVAFDPGFELVDDWVVSRHLDDKAGVACVLEALEHVDAPPVDTHLWFTVFEEVGTGATALLDPDVAEFLAVDLAPVGTGQNSTETAVTIPALDAAGPFDAALVERLFELAEQASVDARRDVFHHYRSDTASAVMSGNDVRVALACYGLHASHGYERTHVRSLEHLTRLLVEYMSQ
jgi:putative aminopeptidase FrvX